MRKGKKSKPVIKVFAITVGIIVVLSALGMYLVFTTPGQPGDQVASGLAPDFTLPIITAEGQRQETVTLSSLRGKVVLLEFMATWCPYCQKMAPLLEELHRSLRGRDVVFISISEKWRGADEASTTKFIQEYNSTWTYLIDNSDVAEEYGVSVVPFFFLIDQSGMITDTFEGVVSAETLWDIINRRL